MNDSLASPGTAPGPRESVGALLGPHDVTALPRGVCVGATRERARLRIKAGTRRDTLDEIVLHFQLEAPCADAELHLQVDSQVQAQVCRVRFRAARRAPHLPLSTGAVRS